MLNLWRLFNFKSVKNDTKLTLGPLTIFAGSNSSGKSTVLQSILLISQTLQNRIGSRSVVLNGPLVKLGQFNDLRSFNSEANQILIGWECSNIKPDYWSGARNISAYSCNFSFEADRISANYGISQLQPHLFSCEIEGQIYKRKYSFISSQRSSTRNVLGPSDILKSKMTEENLEEFLRHQVEVQFPSGENYSTKRKQQMFIGASFRHFMPVSLLTKYLTNQLSSKKNNDQLLKLITITSNLKKITKNISIVHPISKSTFELVELIEENAQYLLKLIDTSPYLGDKPQPPSILMRRSIEEIGETISRIENSEIGKDKDVRIILNEILEILLSIDINPNQEYWVVEEVPLPHEIEEVVQIIENYFTKKIKYLGPLRDEPKSIYPLALSSDPMDIGLRGEFVAAVFDLNKNNQIKYISSNNFSKPNIDLGTTSRSFEYAIQDWLQYLDVAESVKTNDLGKNGHEMKVTTPGAPIPQDLTHVGVGVSQVLPILVMCLLAEPETTLIIEQPELHLHPKVQTLLADFFLSMAILGKQCIIETHSEYIINRLRFRAAAAQSETISSLMKVYFVEKDENNSVFRPVEVNKYGAITDWPDGFFDQSQSEAEEILRAATLKRKAEKGK